MSLESKLNINSFDNDWEKVEGFDFSSKTSFDFTDEELNYIIDSFDSDIVFNDNEIENHEEAFLYIKDVISTPFPEGLKNVPNEFYLYRYLIVPLDKKINGEELGKHWTGKKELMVDEYFTVYLWDLQGGVDRRDEPNNRYVIIAKFKLSDINIEETMKAQLTYPDEHELTLQDKKRKPSEAYLISADMFDENNPLKSKGIKRII